MARGGARPGAGRKAGKSANTSPHSARARARAREAAGNQRQVQREDERVDREIRAPVEFKAKRILAPLTRALAPGGRLIVIEPVVEQLFARSNQPGHRPSSHSAAAGPAHRAGFHRRCGGRCPRARGSSRTEGKSAVHPTGTLTARRSSGSGASARFLLLVPFSSLIGEGRKPI
jgi:hypothetical protein